MDRKRVALNLGAYFGGRGEGTRPGTHSLPISMYSTVNKLIAYIRGPKKMRCS